MPKTRARTNVRRKKLAKMRVRNQALRKTLVAPAKPAAKPAAAPKTAPAK